MLTADLGAARTLSRSRAVAVLAVLLSSVPGASASQFGNGTAANFSASAPMSPSSQPAVPSALPLEDSAKTGTEDGADNTLSTREHRTPRSTRQMARTFAGPPAAPVLTPWCAPSPEPTALPDHAAELMVALAAVVAASALRSKAKARRPKPHAVARKTRSFCSMAVFVLLLSGQATAAAQPALGGVSPTPAVEQVETPTVPELTYQVDQGGREVRAARWPRASLFSPNRLTRPRV
jgi:hypothetical protein